jgi:hypothetical protein
MFDDDKSALFCDAVDENWPKAFRALITFFFGMMMMTTLQTHPTQNILPDSHSVVYFPMFSICKTFEYAVFP